MKQTISLILCISGCAMLCACQVFKDPPVIVSYTIPEAADDGLPVGDAARMHINPQYLMMLTNQIRQDTFKGIHSVLLFKNDTLVYEEYFNGYSRNTIHNLYSASKSFTSALTGVAIDKGYLRADEYVSPWFPEYAPMSNDSPDKQAITVRHLLTMSSGLECNDQDPSSAGQEEKLYKKNDVLKFLWDLPVTDPPGTNTRYCSGGVITLSNLITKSTGTNYTDFAAEHLLAPMGITNYAWNYRESNRYDRPDQIFLRPRDMGKFGLLYLNKGKWNNRQLVSQAWVEESTTKKVFLNGCNYGYLWWLREPVIKGQAISLISAEGNGGQFIFILPDLHIVMVCTGGNINSPLSAQGFNMLFNYIIPAAL